MTLPRGAGAVAVAGACLGRGAGLTLTTRLRPLLSSNDWREPACNIFSLNIFASLKYFPTCESILSQLKEVSRTEESLLGSSSSLSWGREHFDS